MFESNKQRSSKRTYNRSISRSKKDYERLTGRTPLKIPALDKVAKATKRGRDDMPPKQKKHHLKSSVKCSNAF